MFNPIKTCLIILLSAFCPAIMAEEAFRLECLYNYSTALKKHTATTENNNNAYKPFIITADKNGIAPSFCDTVTRGFTSKRLHYLHCQSKDRAVRTEHEMIVDRKSLSVTTTLHFYVNDQFMTGIIHLGKCKYQVTKSSRSAH